MNRRNNQRNRRRTNTFHFAQLEPRQLLAGDLCSLNLIENGDFSNVPTTSVRPNFFESSAVEGWNAANDADGQRVVLLTLGTTRGTALKLDSTADQIDNVFQDVSTAENQTYVVSFELRGQSPGGTVVAENVQVFWNDTLVGEFESRGRWTTHAFVVTGGPGDISRLEFRESLTSDGVNQNDGVGVLIDNVNVVLATDTGITNGSFEDVSGAGPLFANGTVAGWNAFVRGSRPDLIQIQSNGVNPDAPATDGTNVLNLDSSSDLADYVFADFATEAGSQYFVVFDLFADGSQDSNPDELRVRWRTPDSEILPDQLIGSVFGNNSWQSYGFLVDGLGDESRLEFREPAGATTDGSGPLIDNVRLLLVEEVVNDLVVDANGPAAGTSASVELIQGIASAPVASDLTITRQSGGDLTSAAVTIAGSTAQSEDELSVDVGSTGLTQNFDSTTGVLSITGTASAADYQAVLRTLTYTNTSATPTLGQREFSVVVSDSGITDGDQDSAPATITLDIVAHALEIAAVSVQTVEAGSPLFVTLDVTNPADVPLQFTGVSGDASILTPRFETGDSWRLNISSPDATTGGQPTPLDGQLTFQLFEDVFGTADVRPVDRIRTLTQQGFFDGTIFHRIDQDFVIQGGDPDATGRGGSDLGDFDDQFSTLLQHNRRGLLSFAKSFDDTNNSQFFITDGPARFLDFQHSIFGVLTSGEELREDISFVDTIQDPANPTNFEFPANPVRIDSAEIFQDNSRAAVLLVAPEGVTGETTLTVTARDANGNETTREITVNVVAPTDPNSNSNPFLDDIPDFNAVFGVEQTFQLTAQDVENDTVRFLDADEIELINSSLPGDFIRGIDGSTTSFVSDPSFDYSVDPSTGLLTFTPGPVGSPSEVRFVVGVAQEPGAGQVISNRIVDIQVITVNVTEAP